MMRKQAVEGEWRRDRCGHAGRNRTSSLLPKIQHDSRIQILHRGRSSLRATICSARSLAPPCLDGATTIVVSSREVVVGSGSAYQARTQRVNSFQGAQAGMQDTTLVATTMFNTGSTSSSTTHGMFPHYAAFPRPALTVRNSSVSSI